MSDDTDLETLLLGPVLPERSCGGCTACCTTLNVDTPDFSKPAGMPCLYLGKAGCSIHAIRPTICRIWFCAWRRVAEMPDEARPDLSGLLVSLNFVREPRNCFEGVAINVRLLPGSASIENGMAGRVLDSLCTGLVPVWFSDGDRTMLMHPDAQVAAHVIDGTNPPSELAEEVAAWREQYGLFTETKHGTA